MTRTQERARIILRAVRRPWDYELRIDTDPILLRKNPSGGNGYRTGYHISMNTASKLNRIGVEAYQ